MIDDEDAELVAGYAWYPMKHGKMFYAVAYTPGSGDPGAKVILHRLIRPDIEGEIDHKNRNRLDNTMIVKD